jgi:competence protein ComEA
LTNNEVLPINKELMNSNHFSMLFRECITKELTMKKFISILTLATLCSLPITATALADEASITDVKQTVAQTQVVHLNNATLEQLQQLKGIGKVKAQAIIDYRMAQGSFNSVHDLLKVKGIGLKVLTDNAKSLAL